jgi:large subunit ribosomal protein L14
MIQTGTNLLVSDNSGAKKIQCINLLKKSKKKVATIGDIIVVSVKKANPKQRSKAIAGNVYKALIVETKKKTLRKDGSNFKSDRNVAILLNTQNAPMGTRITGPMSYDLKKKANSKIISLASSSI